MSQFLKDQRRVDWPATGTITAPVFWAALIAPGFGILAGPCGPSGVIANTLLFVRNISIISIYAFLPPSVEEPLITFQPNFAPMRAIISASGWWFPAKP